MNVIAQEKKISWYSDLFGLPLPTEKNNSQE